MYNLMIIYFTGMLGIQKAVPLGIMLKTPPPIICLMTILGASTMVIVIYVLNQLVKQFRLRRMNENKLEKRKIKTNKLISKFGIVGLSLIGTVIMGHHITILMGLIVVNKKTKLLGWTIIGIILWTIVLTTAVTLCSKLF